MTRLFLSILLLLSLVQCRKGPGKTDVQTGCIPANQQQPSIVPAGAIAGIMDKYVIQGIPGISFLARKGNAYWGTEKGKSDLQSGKALEACQVWPAFSITKTYTATVIMRLKEEGRLSLDQKINTCLPASIAARIADSDKITVRMLLNHSSGIENFWDNYTYLLDYMSNPGRTYSINDYLEASTGRLFEPGTDASYSNTNYLILALIIDQVTGRPHADAYRKYITDPLGVTETWYKQVPPMATGRVPKLYADIDGSGSLTDYTDLSFVQFANEFGSNSMLATGRDFVDFLHALRHGKLVKGSSFTEMKTWIHSNDESEVYGLGLENYDLGGIEIYGHSGSSFGGRSLLLHIPSKDLSIFIGINASAETGGPLLFTISDFYLELVSALLA